MTYTSPPTPPPSHIYCFSSSFLLLLLLASISRHILKQTQLFTILRHTFKVVFFLHIPTLSPYHKYAPTPRTSHVLTVNIMHLFPEFRGGYFDLVVRFAAIRQEAFQGARRHCEAFRTQPTVTQVPEGGR